MRADDTRSRTHVAADRFRPDIEGLRAIAVALVALSHAGIRPLEGGYVGVDVFFVLSGFLITSLLLREAETTHRPPSIRSFYARRVRRILPAGTMVIVATVLASYVALGFIRGDQVALDASWASAFAANLHFALVGSDYLGSQDLPSPLQHYWSLGVEEQFYAVWPWLFGAIAARFHGMKLRPALIVALVISLVTSLAWSWWQTSSNGIWAYFSPLTRAWELAAGALLAVATPLLRQLRPRVASVATWAGVLGIVCSALVLNRETPFPGTAALFPVGATCLAIAGGTVRTPRNAEVLLGSPPFQWLGGLSYSFYLWHWPALVIPAQIAGTSLTIEQNLGLLSVALLLSALMYATIERPVRFSVFLSRRPSASLALGGALVLLSIGISAWGIANHGAFLAGLLG